MVNHFAITRAGKKIKTWGQAANVAGHNLRLRETWNADPDRKDENVVLVGSDNLGKDIRDVIDRAGIDLKRVRKDAVLAQEWLYTASPGYFRDGDENGPWNAEQTAMWRDATMNHIKRYFGEHRIASVVLHLDEAGSPHIHAVTVPVHEFIPKPRQRKHTTVDEPMPIHPSPLKPMRSLSAFNAWGGRVRFEAHQSAYADAVAHLGLVRGIRGSHRKHQSLKAYYAALKSADEMLEAAGKAAALTTKSASALLNKALGMEEEQTERIIEMENLLTAVVFLARSLAGPKAPQIKTATDILEVLGGLASAQGVKRTGLARVRER